MRSSGSSQSNCGSTSHARAAYFPADISKWRGGRPSPKLLHNSAGSASQTCHSPQHQGKVLSPVVTPRRSRRDPNQGIRYHVERGGNPGVVFRCRLFSEWHALRHSQIEGVRDCEFDDTSLPDNLAMLGEVATGEAARPKPAARGEREREDSHKRWTVSVAVRLSVVYLWTRVVGVVLIERHLCERESEPKLMPPAVNTDALSSVRFDVWQILPT